MNAKHTPGPWSYEDDVIYATNGDLVVSDEWHGSMSAFANSADARLIAAAPELIDALRSMELGANTVVACYTRNPGNFAAALSDLQEYAKQARAVIAKATGQ